MCVCVCVCVCVINKYILDLCINLIYIYLSLLHNCSIPDIEHFLYYIAFGSPQTHKVI